jgi:hypothetical protein
VAWFFSSICDPSFWIFWEKNQTSEKIQSYSCENWPIACRLKITDMAFIFLKNYIFYPM